MGSTMTSGERVVAWQNYMREDIARVKPEWSGCFKAPKNVYLPVAGAARDEAIAYGAKKVAGSVACSYEPEASTALRRLGRYSGCGRSVLGSSG